MSEHFPFFTVATSLSRHDFHHFSLSFTQTIKGKLSVASTAHVSFIHTIEEIDDIYHESQKASRLQRLYSTILQTQAPATEDDCLLLPFSVLAGQPVVAFIEGIDPILVRKIDHDWLQELRDDLQHALLIVKQAGTDPQTGLLNMLQLSTMCNTFPEGEHIGLSFVEVSPKARTAIEEMRYIQRTANALQTFIGENIALYHIGQSIFAYPLWHYSEDEITSVARLIAFLKRERFKSVHIGYSYGIIGSDKEGYANTTGRDLLDEAWQALQTACKRGPFSFCSYQLLQNSRCHPLYASKRNMLANTGPCWQSGQTKELKRYIQQWDHFSLVQFHPLVATESIYDKISEEDFVISGSKKFQGPNADAYLLLPTTDQRKARKLVHTTVQTLTLEGKVHGPVAAGIAIFPFSDFKKTELIPNCQKALLHGALEDEGIITVFNALSLNVSGDIYYGEGDIPRAIKEYRRGLAITPNDVNLLNSLGVSYAMMNRHTLANDCFLQALSIHDHNFMAWYNLGLGRELQNDLTGAVVAFERAYSCPLEGDKDTANVRHELPLQLAKLYCQIGQYQKCLDILLPWHNAKQEKSDAGPASRALRFLGESFHGLGRTQEAIIALQRAIHFDECDADALSLLGEIYLDTNAGNQIALKLCGKSIELNPVPILFHLRLAKAMISCGYLETALVTLRPCLRDQKTKGAARVQMGLLYKKWGKNTTAIRWLNKALTQPEIKINENENEKEWHQQALSSLTELSEK